MENFGLIKESFYTEFSENIVAKNKKNNLNKFIKLLKEDKNLKLQYQIYSIIENKCESNPHKIYDFINETIKVINTVDKKNIVESNKKLSETVKLTNEDYPTKKLHEAINLLILLPNNSKNLNTIVEAKSVIFDYILNNTKKESVINENNGLPVNLVSKLLLKKFNSKYSDTNQLDKDIIKSLVTNNITEQKNIYDNILESCLSLVNSKLLISNDEIKVKLNQVKEKLVQENYSSSDFLEKITSLLSLKETLNDN